MVTLEVLHTLEKKLKPEWDCLTDSDFPFADFDHLHALEVTGCAGPDMGWLPVYLLVRDDNSKLLAASYSYVKSHGYGEFVFDHAWNQAYARAGEDYYPKLVSTVPYTPATGPKVLVHPEADRHLLEPVIAEELKSIARRAGCSSIHSLFLPQEHLQDYLSKQYLLRHSFQYHWFNKGYRTFDDFLAALKSKRRRQIQLERRALASMSEVRIVTKTGPDLTEADADIMARLYLDTNEKWGSIPCLSRDFFRMIFSSMADRIVLFLAEQDGEPFAAALNFVKGRKLFGRYWGTLREVKFLHFELCYYQAIEYCIRRGLAVYEAGAQGEHKIPRGFVPTLTYSCHYLEDQRFVLPVERFLEQEKRLIDEQFKEWDSHLPYL
jgi:predicted N-acyltransferase